MTNQLAHQLTYEGEVHSLGVVPGFPLEHPQIVETVPTAELMETMPPLLLSTACWRRYVSTWSVVGDRLFLDAIQGRFAVIDGPIEAEWVSGTLMLPLGPPLPSEQSYLGVPDVPSEERWLKFERGRLTESRHVRNLSREPHERDRRRQELYKWPWPDSEEARESWAERARKAASLEAASLEVVAPLDDLARLRRQYEDEPLRVDPLIDRARHHLNDAIRNQAVTALGNFPPSMAPQVADVLWRLSLDWIGSTRLAAAHALAVHHGLGVARVWRPRSVLRRSDGGVSDDDEPRVAAFPPLPAPPPPPVLPTDPRQARTQHILGSLGARLGGTSAIGTHTGYRASAVDVGRLQEVLERGLTRFDEAALARRWDDDVQRWIIDLLQSWVQRAKRLHVERIGAGIRIEIETQDDLGYYTYGLDVLPRRG